MSSISNSIDNKDNKDNKDKNDLDDKCVCCLDKKAYVMLPCKHTCLCIICTAALFQKFTKPLCPLCRQEFTKNTYFTEHNNLNKAIDPLFEDATDLFSCLEIYLNSISPSDITKTTEIVQNIYTIFDSLFSTNSLTLKLLTLTQTINLLNIIHNKKLLSHHPNYCLQHIIVAMCRNPWNVPTELGSSGVCYYGNLGETPELHKAIVYITTNNIPSLTKKHFLSQHFP